MTSPTTDRRQGLVGNTPFKAPVDCATTANITLSGEQTVDGFATSTSRVLVKNQTNATQNGIYNSSSAAWNRADDADGNYDLVKGSQVLISGGNQSMSVYVLTSSNPITIGTSALTWSQSLSNGFLATLAAAAGATLIGWIQAGVSAVARTISDKLFDDVSVLDFMTSAQRVDVRAGTFGIDVTSAISAATASGAKRIRFPAGGYLISSAVSVPANVMLTGDGAMASIIRVSGSGYDAVTLAGDYSGVERLGFYSTTQRTAGRTVVLPNSTRSNRVMSCRFENQFNPIGITGSAVITWVHDCDIVNTTVTTGVSIDIQGGNDTYITATVCDAPNGAQPLCGLRINVSQAVWVTDSDFIHQGIGLSVSPGNGQVITWLFFNNSAFDTCSTDGIQISPSGTGSVRGVFFNGCWSSTNTVRGVLIQKAAGATVDGVFLDQFKCLNNGQQGILLLNGPNNVRISDSVVSGNSLSSSGTYSGIDIQANASNWSVNGGRVGSSLGFAASQAYGIVVNAGTSDVYSIRGVDVTGNVTGGIFDGGSGTSKFIAQNIGFVTQNSGTNNVAIAASTCVVTHGLAATPTSASINVVPTQNIATSGIASWWISAIGATTFTVNTNTNVAGAAFTFGWNARVSGA